MKTNQERTLALIYRLEKKTPHQICRICEQIQGNYTKLRTREGQDRLQNVLTVLLMRFRIVFDFNEKKATQMPENQFRTIYGNSWK